MYSGGSIAGNGYSGVLGQYEYDKIEDYYVQTTTYTDTLNFEKIYLYRAPDGYFNANNEPFVNRGYIVSNQQNVDKVPKIGWRYAVNNSDYWYFDNNLQVITGGLSSVHHCNSYHVAANEATAEMWSSYLGEFTITPDFNYGRPIYRNIDGRLLYVWKWGTWYIGDNLNSHVIHSGNRPMFPELSKVWYYLLGIHATSYGNADLTITCQD